MDKITIPLDVVLDLVGGLCSDCAEKVRQRIAQQQFLTKHTSLRKPLDDILTMVSAERLLSLEDILSDSQDVRLVDARREVAFRARNHGYDLKNIAEILRRDTSTISRLLNGGA